MLKGRWRTLLWRCLLATGVSSSVSGLAAAAVPPLADSREYPSRQYYLAMQLFEEGEFLDAAQGFLEAGRAGVQSSEGRWVDSICYFAMLGECHYQMGDLAKASEQYASALNLLIAYPAWMLRVEFSPTIEPANRVLPRPITWGAPARRMIPGRFSERYRFLQGQLDLTEVIRRGGVLVPPSYRLINAHEIVRCAALALRRRRELLGVACPYDPLTTRLAEALSARPAPAGHWSQAWISVLLGLVYASSGKAAEAIRELRNGVLAGGQFDHPLTATALVELGKLSFEQRQYPEAANDFLEATYTAAVFGQPTLMEEAFRWATLVHILRGAKGPYPPLEPAAAWSRRVSRFLEASLLLDAAESAAELSQAAPASALLERARGVMARTPMLAGAPGARLNYVAALVAYQSGNLAAGDKALAALLAYQKKNSRRLFELAVVDRLLASGVLGEGVANELCTLALREPTADDWILDPVETLTVTLAPPMAQLERWLELAIRRNEGERALEIADLIRRRRFFAAIPVGGRLQALRCLLDADADTLDEPTRGQRANLFQRYPRYAELARRAVTLRQELKAAPLLPGDEAARRQQAARLAELGSVSQQQEIMLRELAIRRVPCEFSFPPRLDSERIKAGFPEGVLVLSFLATSRTVYGLSCGRRGTAVWEVPAAPRAAKDTAELLRQIGQVDRNHPVDPSWLKNDAWKAIAERLLLQLTKNADARVWDDYEELAIVPDGILWYLPFEILQVAQDGGRLPLISKIRMRYVPTVSLIWPDSASMGPGGTTAVALGSLFPRDDETLAKEAFDRFQRAVKGTLLLPNPLPAPSHVFAGLCDRLVVLADIEESARGFFDWSPMYIDRGRPGSTLAAWMSLPWGGPRQIVLPGFHTAAESGLRKGNHGEEVCSAVCGLMAAGARTILLSRWRTGGQTSYDLVREFVQELPYRPASEAWQRSVRLVMQDELLLDREPRVKAESLDVGIRADHPFFWGGYLLVDTGAYPAGHPGRAKPLSKKEEKPAAEPPKAPPGEKGPEKPAADKEADKPGADIGADAPAAGKSGGRPPAEAKAGAP